MSHQKVSGEVDHDHQTGHGLCAHGPKRWRESSVVLRDQFNKISPSSKSKFFNSDII